MFGPFGIFGFGGAAHHRPPQPAQAQTKPPPASKRVLSNLPKIIVTADDLLEVTNKECLICLEEQKLGTEAVKLQCGHIYHERCLKDWLLKSCTCPVCRYELETDDAEYEAARKARMKKRRLRCRRDELEHMSIAKLRETMNQLSVSYAGCVDKRELVERLISSGMIELTEGIPVIELSRHEFEGKSVSELKKLILSFGLDAAGALEKSELRQRILDSGRVTVIDDENDETGAVLSHLSSSSPPLPRSDDAAAEPAARSSPLSSPVPQSSSSSSSSSPRVSASGAAASASASIITMSSDEFHALGVSDLKKLIVRFRLSEKGLLEKEDFRHLLLESGHIILTE